MGQAKVKKPEHLSLLNAICLQEGRAGVFLKSWSDNTQDAALKECLDFVADRETSHYHIFKRRIKELGFELVEEAYPDFSERLGLVSSDIPDAEKIRRLQELEQRQPKPTIRDRYEAATDDMAVDPLTRSLLRWFADVEEDSRSLMADIYSKVEGKSQV